MRILLISNYAPSLIAFRGDLLRMLAGLGHEVSAAIPGPLGAVPQQLAERGVTCHELPFARNSLSPIGEIAMLRRLYELLARVRPDLLLLYTIKPVIYGSLMAAAIDVPRVACMIPGLGYLFGDGGGWRRALLATGARLGYQAALARAERVFFQNPDDAADFARWGLVRKRQTVVLAGSGVDTTHYHPGPPHEPCSFLLIARLLREKGIAVYAEASRRLRRTHPHARCYLLGPRDPGPDGIPDEDLKHWVDDGVLDYLGETADVRPYLTKAAVVVLPSHYREGVPRVLLEAMAMAKPIITTDTPGCRETIRGGRNGILIPPRDPAALAHAMSRLANDPGESRRMGEAGRSICEDTFSVERVNSRICLELGLLPTGT